MTSQRYLPVLLACVGSLMPAAALASSIQEPPMSDVIVSSASVGTEAVLVAESPRGRLEHRASTSGTGTIVATAGDDRLEVRVSREVLRVSRNGRHRTLSARAFTADEVRAVQDLLQDAPAVLAVGALLQGLAGNAPAPLVTAAAFVRLLAGDASGMRRVSGVATPVTDGFRFASQEAAACWSSYQNSMWIFFQDLESCISSSHWNLPVQYACGFTYLVQSEIAWFGLIACGGGLPTD